jgi:hypothetical protein
MSTSLPPNRTQSPHPCRSVRHAAEGRPALRVVGAATEPLTVAALPPVSAVAVPPPEPASAPIARTPVVAALTTFEGRAVLQILSPGSSVFRAGDVFRFRRGSRGTSPRSA